MPRSSSPLQPFASALLLILVMASAVRGEDRVVVAWDETPTGPSFVRAIEAQDPWPYASSALATDGDGIVHVVGDRAYHLSRKTGRLLVIDVDDWSIVRTHDFGAASEPRDITVLDAATAYLARAKSTQLARVDLVSGATTDVVDLGPFADADGFPEMNRMLAFEGRLYVQLRRIDFSPMPGSPLPPLIAVVDLATEELVDADPVREGAQAITLVGTAPRFDMQVLPASRRLLVSATGFFHDAGGLEVIDVDTLQSLGLAVEEFGGNVGADLGAFTMLDEEAGYLSFSTDLLLSSHLHRFTLTGGSEPTEFHFALNYFVPSLVLDRAREQMFWPEPGGIHVFDTATGARLTRDPIPVNGAPTDLAYARALPAVPGLSRVGVVLAAMLLVTGLAFVARSKPIGERHP